MSRLFFIAILAAISALALCLGGFAEGAGKAAAPDMALVKGGCFEMGDPFPQASKLDGDPDEKPLHEVCLDDYYIGKYEVTRGQFAAFVAETGYRTEAERGAGCYIIYGGRLWTREPDLNWTRLDQDDDHPVACVTWNDAAEFIAWKRRKTGAGWRLPTEAEWEFAARSRGKVRKYPWGDSGPSGNIADEAARKALPEIYPDKTYWKGYDDGFVFSSPVGSFAPNELGLYDMSGNVWEWTADYYDVFYYRKSPRVNPKGNRTDGSRVRKGGSWSDDSRHQRIANRSRSFQDRARFDLGFRLAMDP